MNTATSAIQSKSKIARCSHRTRSGRLCRLPVLDRNAGLCFRHSGLRAREVDSGDLSPELLGEASEFQSLEDVHEFLARLLVLMVRNRISNKRAAVLTYICAQLTRIFSTLERQAAAHDDNVVLIVDGPRPLRPQETPQ
jgi:hypothetical protein